MAPHRTIGALPRSAARPAFGSIASGVYPAVLAVVSALVAYDLFRTEHQDASFAAVLLVLVAAPAMPALLAGGALARPVTGAPRRQARMEAAARPPEFGVHPHGGRGPLVRWSGSARAAG
ncbi:SCO4225 family membrane protein [Streptomyces fradiae]|uniref:SCO4225 family membrane protein n=1 Tax=Streptomyces fradiae TaxID=1906 RepID=UPI0035BE6DB4